VAAAVATGEALGEDGAGEVPSTITIINSLFYIKENDITNSTLILSYIILKQ
jgi:hypothetical protein